MSTIDDGGPAFPQYLPAEQSRKGSHGMSLRDYFAGQALAAMLATNAHEEGYPGDLAQWSYDYADAMLTIRKKAGQ